MGIKKKILSGQTLEAWSYEVENQNNGQAIGVFNKEKHRSEAIILVDALSSPEGMELSILIDVHLAKEHGFKVKMIKEIHTGHSYTFKSNDSELKKYNDTKATVIRRLHKDERNEDAGNMFSVRFYDGYVSNVLEEELVG